MSFPFSKTFSNCFVQQKIFNLNFKDFYNLTPTYLFSSNSYYYSSQILSSSQIKLSFSHHSLGLKYISSSQLTLRILVFLQGLVRVSTSYKKPSLILPNLDASCLLTFQYLVFICVYFVPISTSKRTSLKAGTDSFLFF